MSNVIAIPGLMATAAADLANIGSTLSAAHAAAAPSTSTLPPAAADEISANIAQLFSAHAQDYQDLAGRAATFHQQFVDRLTASAGAYGSAESANTAALQPALEIASTVPTAAAIQIPALNSFVAALNLLLTILQNPFGFFIGPIIAAAVEIVISLVLRTLIAAIGGITFTVPTA